MPLPAMLGRTDLSIRLMPRAHRPRPQSSMVALRLPASRHLAMVALPPVPSTRGTLVSSIRCWLIHPPSLSPRTRRGKKIPRKLSHPLRRASMRPTTSITHKPVVAGLPATNNRQPLHCWHRCWVCCGSHAAGPVCARSRADTYIVADDTAVAPSVASCPSWASERHMIATCNRWIRRRNRIDAAAHNMLVHAADALQFARRQCGENTDFLLEENRMRSIVVRPEDGLWFQTRTQSAPYSSSSIAFAIKPIVKAPRSRSVDSDPDRPSQIPTWPPPSIDTEN
jgi:hypothetical protein